MVYSGHHFNRHYYRQNDRHHGLCVHFIRLTFHQFVCVEIAWVYISTCHHYRYSVQFPSHVYHVLDSSQTIGAILIKNVYFKTFFVYCCVLRLDTVAMTVDNGFNNKGNQWSSAQMHAFQQVSADEIQHNHICPKHSYKNIERRTAHTIVSWPNPKQWVIVHTSDLMMIISQSIYILSIITKGMGKLKTHSPTYCIMDDWENMLNLTHTLDKLYLTGIL